MSKPSQTKTKTKTKTKTAAVRCVGDAIGHALAAQTVIDNAGQTWTLGELVDVAFKAGYEAGFSDGYGQGLSDCGAAS